MLYKPPKIIDLYLHIMLASFLSPVHDLQPFGVKLFNMSHTVNKLSFGQEYPGIINPLDGHNSIDAETEQGISFVGIFVFLVGLIKFCLHL